jgi:hypothetical protein
MTRIPSPTPPITRLEVIGANGRSYVNYRVAHVEFSLQDNDRTLKIFVKERENSDD